MKRTFSTASVAAACLLGGVVAGSIATHGALAGHTAAAGSQSRASVRSAGARAAAVAFLLNQHAPGHRAPRQATVGPNGITDSYYYNWSGYAGTGSTGTFTKVSGSWKVSKLTCTGEHQVSAEWVGLDGYNNSTVEQDGTLSECFEGTVYYYDWYEMYPAALVVEHDVSAGDTVSGTVSRSGSSYTLTVTDSTHSADSFTTTATCTSCDNDSAEWINERTDFSCCGYVPLPDYGTWTLSKGTATAAGKSESIGSLSTVYDITMVDATDSYDLATTSALSGGNSFTTTWKDSW